MPLMEKREDIEETEEIIIYISSPPRSCLPEASSSQGSSERSRRAGTGVPARDRLTPRQFSGAKRRLSWNAVRKRYNGKKNGSERERDGGIGFRYNGNGTERERERNGTRDGEEAVSWRRRQEGRRSPPVAKRGKQRGRNEGWGRSEKKRSNPSLMIRPGSARPPFGLKPGPIQ